MQNIFDVELLRRSPVRVKRIRRWIRALRDGTTYKQGNGFLRVVGTKRSDDKFCCLGVMLDLDQPKGWIDVEQTRMGRTVHTAVAHRMSSEAGPREMPSAEACRRYGLFVTQQPPNGGHSKLAQMNDNRQSFKQIANKLDRSLKEALLAAKQSQSSR